MRDTIIKWIETNPDRELVDQGTTDIGIQFFRNEKYKDKVLETVKECDISIIQGLSHLEAGILNFGALCIYIYEHGDLLFSEDKGFYLSE